MRRTRSTSHKERLRKRFRPNLDTNHETFIDSEKQQDQVVETFQPLKATFNDANDAGICAIALEHDHHTPLHLAVLGRNLITFRTLLPRTPNVNTRARDGMTPLLSAVKNGMADMTIDLLKAGAEIDAADLKGMTALHWASMNNNFHLVDVLLMFSPNLNIQDSHGFTPLHYAKTDVAKYLLKAGAKTSVRDNDGFTPLHLAVLKMDTTLFRKILYHTNDMNTHCGPDGMTPLTSAVKNSTEPMVRELLKAGADVNLTSGDEMTALHWAADFSKLPNRADAAARRAIAKILLNAGADANLRNLSGDTPLHVALNTKAWPVFNVLLQHKGTDLNAVDASGKPPLIMLLESASKSKAEAFKAFIKLIKAGASMYAGDKEMRTPLHYATILDKYDELIFMIKSGVNVNTVDQNKMTPLHYAGLFRILEGMPSGANSNAGEGYGQTPLDHDKAKIVKSLVEAGADTNAKNSDGATPLYLAVVRRDVNAFRVILDHATNLNFEHTESSGLTPLIAAVDLGMADMVFDLIRAGADISAMTCSGNTPLHYAAKSYNENCAETATGRAIAAKILLDAGADPNAKNNYGDTVLHAAVKAVASWPVLRELLRDGRADVNARNMCDDGKTPLMMLLERRDGDVEIFQDLLKAGASVTEMDKKGRTVLHYATRFNKCNELKLLLQTCGVDVNAADEAGNTALLTAAELDLHEAYTILQFADDIDVNVQRKIDGKTLLMIMLESNAPTHEIQYAVERAADIHVKDKKLKSALHYAAKFERAAELYTLLELGAKINDQDCKGQTPLFVAVREGSYASCFILLRFYYLNRDIADKNGKRPIDIAMEKNFEDIVDLLNESMPAG